MSGAVGVTIGMAVCVAISGSVLQLGLLRRSGVCGCFEERLEDSAGGFVVVMDDVHKVV